MLDKRTPIDDARGKDMELFEPCTCRHSQQGKPTLFVHLRAHSRNKRLDTSVSQVNKGAIHPVLFVLSTSHVKCNPWDRVHHMHP